MTFHVPEKFRVRSGRIGSDASFGNNGAFVVELKRGQIVFVIASDMMGWEHVSVSRRDRIPTWEEMCQVKELFWDDEDAVMQIHPAKSEWISNHDNCLHLWRPLVAVIPLPPSIMVGVRGIDAREAREAVLKGRKP